MTGDLIDTHCHIDAYPDTADVLGSAAAAGVQVVAVTNTPDAYNRLATLLPRSGPARPALGLHPLHAHQLGMTGVLRFSRLAAQAAWIGEIGLDFSPAGRAPASCNSQSSKHCSRSRNSATVRSPCTAGALNGKPSSGSRTHESVPSCTGTPARSPSPTTRSPPACHSPSTPQWWPPPKAAPCSPGYPTTGSSSKPTDPMHAWQADPARQQACRAFTDDLARLWKATPGYVRDTIVDNQQRLLA